ncbi:hypothetical protein EES46_04435 [Streptomyces sp. ADI98-10]|nr:hypothetical protein EES46_04435 [Streptomyces sp. ADI98-10]
MPVGDGAKRTRTGAVDMRSRVPTLEARPGPLRLPPHRRFPAVLASTRTSPSTALGAGGPLVPGRSPRRATTARPRFPQPEVIAMDSEDVVLRGQLLSRPAEVSAGHEDRLIGPRPFGHTRRSGSLDLADPRHGITFGYAVNNNIAGGVTMCERPRWSAWRERLFRGHLACSPVRPPEICQSSGWPSGPVDTRHHPSARPASARRRHSAPVCRQRDHPNSLDPGTGTRLCQYPPLLS